MTPASNPALKGSKPFALPALVLATSSASNQGSGAGQSAPEWIKLFPGGVTHTNDRRVFVNNAPEDVIARTKAAGLDVPVDIQHGMELGSPEPAMGWVKDLEVRAGDIWAQIDWTDIGREKVLAKHYRYVSPAVLLDKEKRVIKLTSIALTNKPAIAMPALASANMAKGFAAGQTSKTLPFTKMMEISMDDETLAQWRTVLKLSSDADESAVRAALAQAAQASSDPKATPDTAAAPAPTSAPDPAPKETAADAPTPAPAPTATAPDAAAAPVAKTPDAPAGLPKNPNPEHFVYKADYDAVVQKLGETQEQNQASLADAPSQDEVKDAVEMAMTSGLIAPSTKGYHLEACSSRSGFDNFKAMVKISPKIVSGEKAALATQLSPESQGGVPRLTDNQLAMCESLGVSPKDYALTLAASSAPHIHG